MEVLRFISEFMLKHVESCTAFYNAFERNHTLCLFRQLPIFSNMQHCLSIELS